MGGTQSMVLEGLRSRERSLVLDRLLADHPDLQAEAETHAREVLSTVDQKDVADHVVEVYLGMDIHLIGSRVGPRQGRGYVDENEAAWELLEDALEPFIQEITRRARLGFPDAAKQYAAGVLAGLDELRGRAGQDTVFRWGPADEAAAELGWSVRKAVEQIGARPPEPSTETRSFGCTSG